MVKVDFDIEKFKLWFEKVWPDDSPASISYKNRIINGTSTSNRRYYCIGEKMIRRATKEDIKVIEGLFNFIKSLEIDILKDYSEEKVFKVLEYVFSSEYDRFSYKKCTVYEIEGVIKGFSFTYYYDEVEKMKEFWYSEVVSNFDLKKDSMIFDYDEVLVGEFYLDTLFVFLMLEEKVFGNKLLNRIC